MRNARSRYGIVAWLTLHEQRGADVAVGQGVFGIRVQCLPKVLHRLVQLPLANEFEAEVVVSDGGLGAIDRA